MNASKAPDTVDHRRRRIVGATAMTFAATELGLSAPQPWTTRITSASSYTITAGGSAWHMASRSMTFWKTGWPKLP